METSEEVAKEAARAALNLTINNGTLKKYQAEIVKLIKVALITALTEVEKSAAAREKQLTNRIEHLEKQVKFLENSKGNLPGPSFASILSGKSNMPEAAKQHQQLLKLVTSVNKSQKVKESNVIVIGLTNLNKIDERANVENFFIATGTDEVHVVHAQRLINKKDPSSASQIVKVTLGSPLDKEAVLESCRHHTAVNYENVFVREDRTQAEQLKFNEDRVKMKERNNELMIHNLLDNPFRNVIHRRTGKIVCIDVAESSDQKKYVFKSAAEAIAAAKSKRHNSAPNTPTENRTV
jgi:hypothetical protein